MRIVTSVVVFGGLVLSGVLLATGIAGTYWRHQQHLVYTRALVAHTAFEISRRLEEWPSGHPLPVVLCGPASAQVPSGVWQAVAPTRPEAMFGHNLAADAWGRCLVVNLNDSNLLRPVWVVSAGPDGRIQTSPDSPSRLGDDIVVRIR